MAIVSEEEVARSSRDWQGRILGTEPNLAFPAGMAIMLVELNRLTLEIEAANKTRERSLTEPTPDTIDIDLGRWRVRLDNYMRLNSEAPPHDRFAILHTITEPLLLGWHGGRTGTEVTLPAGGYPPGFNTQAQHTADVQTPYSVANQLDVASAFERENRDRAIEEMKNRAKAVVEGIGTYWPWILGGVAVVVGGGVALYFGLQARSVKRALLSDNAA